MKRGLQTILGALITCTAISTQCEINFNDHGLYFGRLNHLQSEAAFYQAQKNGQHVVFKFSANWCGPCQQLTTTLQKLAAEFENVLFIEIEISRFNTLKSKFNIRRIPTVIFFKDGAQVHRSTGAQTKTYWTDVIRDSFGL